MYLCIYTNLDQVIWECNVYDTIVPEKCKLYARTRVEVKLMKKNSGLWKKFLDPTVCLLVHTVCVMMYIRTWIVDIM